MTIKPIVIITVINESIRVKGIEIKNEAIRYFMGYLNAIRTWIIISCHYSKIITNIVIKVRINVIFTAIQAIVIILFTVIATIKGS